jgi:predicted transcriptional regulator
MQDTVLKINNWKLKIEERKRNRMKIQIKMGKEEAEAFKNFMENLRPDNVSTDEFIRHLFYKGVESFQQELYEKMQNYIEDNKDNIDASAVEILGHDASAMAGAPTFSENVDVIED